MSVGEETIRQWLNTTFSRENIINPKLTLEQNSNKGDGYMSELTFVKIESEDKKILNVVVKSSNPDLEEYLPIADAFYHEICFYKDVYPKYEEILRSAKVDIGIPKVYDCFIKDQQKVIILEDLKIQGYSLLSDKKKGLDLEHVKMVLTEYGKLHALSFAALEKDPEHFSKIGAKLTNLYLCFERKGDLEFPRNIFKDYYKIWPTNSLEILDNIEKDFRYILIEMEKTCEPSVIIHGDAWINNLFFKYSDGKLQNVSILDYQYLRFASPIFDIVFFLCGSCDQNGFDDIDNLLEYYYKNFSDFLKKLGCDPEKIFSYEKFLEHWRMYAKFGFVMAPLLIKLLLTEPDEAPEGDEESMEYSKKEIRNSKLYYERIATIAQYFLKNHLL